MFVLVEDTYMEDTYSDEYNTEVFWIFFNRSAPNTLKTPSPGIVFLDFALGDKG